MNVEMNNKISMKPGFGKKLSKPTFNQNAFSSRGADSSVFNSSTTLNRTSLKESVGKSISSTNLNRSFSTGYTSSGSSVFGNRSTAFTPGTHFLGTSDFSFPRNDLRNGINTTGIGYDSSVKGYRSGKHDLELMTGGWTQRSERRALQRQGMVDLNTLQEPSGGGKKKSSWLKTLGIGGLIAGVGVGAYFGIKGLINKNKASKAEAGQTDMAKLNELAQQNQNRDSAEVKGQSSQAASVKSQTTPQSANGNKADLALKDDPAYVQLQNKETELNTQSQQIDSNITSMQSKISQSRSNEGMARIALDAANKYVDSLNEQLSDPNLSDLQKTTLQASLSSAKKSVEQKQAQLEQAQQNTQSLQSDLASLQNEKTEIQNNLANVAQDMTKLTAEHNAKNTEAASAKKAEEEAAQA